MELYIINICFIVLSIKIIMQVLKCIKIRFIAFRVTNGGDIIQFIQYLFNLSFKESMQKLNEDFNLGLDSNTKIDYKKITEITFQRQLKEFEKQKNQAEFNSIAEKRIKYLQTIETLNDKINVDNWENLTLLVSKIQTKCELLDLELDELDKKISSR